MMRAIVRKWKWERIRLIDLRRKGSIKLDSDSQGNERILDVSSFSFPRWGKMRKARKGNDVDGKPVSMA